jgi:proton-translocating NADH-quinone oxidoreductase chain N
MLILPLAASPVIYLVGRMVVRHKGMAAPNPARWLALAAMAATLIPLYYAGQAYLAQQPVALELGHVAMRMDGIGLLLACIALGLGIFATLFSVDYMSGEPGEEKFYALLTIMVATMMGLGCSGDLFNLWIWFEAMAISSYMLVAFYRDEAASLEAGVKYLVQSAVGSTMVLLAISMVFLQTGTLDLVSIRTASSQNLSLSLAAGALFLIGFGVKTALVPLHTWLPDAHSQAPSGISAMLSGVVIETGLIAMLRALGALMVPGLTWGNLLMGFGAFNMLVGNLMALRQKQVKRLLAYSSVSHMGYMLVGFGVAVAFQQTNGAAGGFFHMINHSIMKGLAFLSAGAFLYALHLARHDHSPLMIDDLNGASRKYPVVAFAFSVAVLGLGGLPPLAGFMSKWQIFVAGFQTQNAAAMLLVIFAALNSVLSLGYYAPMVNRIYRGEPSEVVTEGKPVTLTMVLPLVILTAAVVVIGFWPSIFNGLTNPAAMSLISAFSGK